MGQLLGDCQKVIYPALFSLKMLGVDQLLEVGYLFESP